MITNHVLNIISNLYIISQNINFHLKINEIQAFTYGLLSIMLMWSNLCTYNYIK